MIEEQVSISVHPHASVAHFRWVICALLFFAATINYMDRQIIGLLKPILAKEFHWTEIDYGHIVFYFQLAYAIGLVVIGGFIDRIGVKRGFSLAVILWSIAAAAHGFARSVHGFCAARFGLAAKVGHRHIIVLR